MRQAAKSHLFSIARGRADPLLKFFPGFELGEKFLQFCENFFGIDAVRFQRNGGTAIEIGTQDIDKTAGRISFPVFHQPDLGAGVFGAFHELGGGASVQTELIRDADLALRGNGRAFIKKSHAWLVPQRRCRNLSIGEKKILSASKPMTTITSMMAMT